MNADKDIGKELLRQAANEDGASAGEAAAKVQKAIRKARRRVRNLAIATLTLWSAVATGVVWMMAGFFIFVWPRIVEEIYQASQGRQSKFDWYGFTETFWNCALGATIAWGALILLAAICTVAFIYASRSATLKQIQASLAEISERLGPTHT